jgi:hypothetical protein
MAQGDEAFSKNKIYWNDTLIDCLVGGDQGPTCKVKGFGGDLKEKIYTSILKGISQANVACQNLARNQQ